MHKIIKMWIKQSQNTFLLFTSKKIKINKKQQQQQTQIVVKPVDPLRHIRRHRR